MRAYLSADARCRQLERLVRKHPGITLEELHHQANIAYQSTAAYMTRLVREGRAELVADGPRGFTKRFYPPGEVPAAQKQAA